MIPALIQGALSLGMGWLTNKKEKQQATHVKDIELIKSRTSWEETQAANAATSWKDEWFTLLLSIPLVGAFVPDMVPYIREGFFVLDSMPEYYKGFLAVAMGASFGVKAITKWGKK